MHFNSCRLLFVFLFLSKLQFTTQCQCALQTTSVCRFLYALPVLQIVLIIFYMSFLQNMEIITTALGLALEKAFFSLKGSYGVTFSLSCES